MIIDITGIILTPGNHGLDCLGNGANTDAKGNKIECCCDECDYLLCCAEEGFPRICVICPDSDCPEKSSKN